MTSASSTSGEDPLDVTLHSQLAGPLDELSWLRRSLLLAEISALSYYREDVVRRAAARLALGDVRFLDRDGAQAYLLASEHDCVVVFRGTEPHEWNDLRADVNAASVVAETVGRVHRGFKEEVDDLWPRLEEALAGDTRTLWLAGHSLGGALATICGGRCALSPVSSHPKALYTYGSPRVGNRRYVNYVRIEHFRWVNNNDIVTRMPPAWFGYRHSGREIYLDARGRIRRLSGWRRTLDRVRGFFRGLARGKIDQLSDHAIDVYVEYIRRAVQEEEG